MRGAKDETSLGGPDVAFRDTLWTVVFEAGERSRESLEALCRQYWKPIYFFIRRRGHRVEEAKDLTQGFFAMLLEGEALRTAAPHRGRFRTFLLTLLTRYLSNEADRAAARKRGGGAQVLSLDFDSAESRFRSEPETRETPERHFHRQWARDVVLGAAQRLERETDGPGFEILRAFLTADPASYRDLAERLGTTESAVTGRLHRLRGRLQELIREQIRQSVASSRDLESELRDLHGFL